MHLTVMCCHVTYLPQHLLELLFKSFIRVVLSMFLCLIFPNTGQTLQGQGFCLRILWIPKAPNTIL